MTSSRPSLFSFRSQRLRICLMLLLALFTVISLRVILSISMVCMVKRTSKASSTDSAIDDTNATSLPMSLLRSNGSGPLEDFAVKEHCAFPGELEWSVPQQSLLLSATFYGSFACVLFSGTLTERFGPKRVLSMALSISIIIAILSPSIARLSYHAYFASRLLIGMTESFLLPTLNLVTSRWFPATEKSTAVAMWSCGTQLAAGFSSFTAAEICQSKALGGWPTVFYLFGTIGAVIVGAWLLIASDYPASSRLASAAEKAYLSERVPKKKPAPPLRSIPLRTMLSAPPVHSIIGCSFAFGFSTSLMQAYLPSYLVDRLGLPIETVGTYTLAPFISQAIAKLIVGPSVDRIIAAGYLSHTRAMKIAQATMSFGSAITLCLLAFVPSAESPRTAFFILACYGVFCGIGVCGFFISLLSIAPAFAGTLSSVSQTATMIAMISPSLVVTLLTYLQTGHKWTIVFCIAAVLLATSGLHFAIFGSADQQEWGRVQPNAPIKSAENGAEVQLKLITE